MCDGFPKCSAMFDDVIDFFNDLDDDFFLSKPSKVDHSKMEGKTPKIAKRKGWMESCREQQYQNLALEANEYNLTFKGSNSSEKNNVATFGRSASVASTLTCNSSNSLNDFGTISMKDISETAHANDYKKESIDCHNFQELRNTFI